MDIISQLQEQVNTIASMAFNTFGSLQRDAPATRLSQSYPEPPATTAPAPAPATAGAGAPSAANAAATGANAAATGANAPDDASNFADQPKLMSTALVKAAKQFDALVAALPLSEGGEEAQLKRIAELQAENDAVGQELQRQLEAAEKELKQVQELFGEATDNCLNMKKPD